MKTHNAQGADWQVTGAKATVFVVADNWTAERLIRQLKALAFFAREATPDDAEDGDAPPDNLVTVRVSLDRLEALLSHVAGQRRDHDIGAFPTVGQAWEYVNGELTAEEYDRLPWSGCPRFQVRHAHQGETMKDTSHVLVDDATARARALKSIANGKVFVVDLFGEGEPAVYTAPG